MDWWVTALLALAAGLAGGFLLGRQSDSAVRRSRELDRELHEARDELERYRAQVAEHFSSTADLVNTMTANYRAVYEHLANGAQQLCGDQELRLQAMEQSRSLPEADGGAASGEPAREDAVGEQPPQHDTSGDGEEPSGEGKQRAADSAKERLDGWYEDIERESTATEYVKEEGDAEKDRVH